MSQYGAELDALTARVKRDHIGWDLSGGDLEEGQVSPLREYLQVLFQEVEEVSFLLHHEHHWDRNNYCFYCGRDGNV